MILSQNVKGFHGLRIFENDELLIGWRGFIFSREFPDNGKIESFLPQLFKRYGIYRLFNYLNGHYFIYIYDKNHKAGYIAIDNAGLYHAFYADQVISSSFLELVRHPGQRKLELDLTAIVEFMQTGCFYSGRTLIKDIKKVDRHSIVRIDQNGKLQFLKKEFTDFNEPIESSVQADEVILNLLQALPPVKMSVDLTGGIDSRLLIALISQTDLSFFPAISGMPEIADVKIARKIAHILKRDLLVTIHDIENLQDEMRRIFLIGDGLTDLMQYHRLYQFMRERKRAGAELAMNGLGGELFKDLYWMQDFPFYNRKRSDLNKLIDIHVLPSLNCMPLLSMKAQEILKNLKQIYVAELQQYVMDTNSRTYDQIYYNWRLIPFGGRYVTNHLNIIPIYVPLMEPEVVRCGYFAPRNQRFFNRIHRRIISRYSPELSVVETTEGGMSCSDRPDYIFRDLFKFTYNRVMRVVRKVNYKLTGRLVYYESPNHPQIAEKIREMADFQESLDYLKDEGVLREDVSPAEIPDFVTGRVLNLGYFIKYLRGYG